jgi:cation diffusion facilitator CzcD-associated flavoprotein CzcO
VKDPEKARKLMPTEPYARRPLCDGGYYEQFNRENVDVVDLRETPIIKITPNGILTADGTEHELDVIIFATGFEAVDGNYTGLKIQGRNQGETLADHWRSTGPRSYKGVSVAGFPNLFLVTGPQGAFSNIPSLIESQVEFITRLIEAAGKRQVPAVEASQTEEDKWLAQCDRLAEGSIFKEAQSWIFGANVPGQKPSTRFYFGGLGNYRKELQAVIDEGFKGFPSLTKASA